MIVKRRARGVPAKWRWCKRAGWSGLAAILVTIVLLAFPESFLLVAQTPVQCDAIVLLGGAPGERDPVVADLFRRGFAKSIVVTGRDDCLENLRLLAARGVPTNAIIIECGSRSTQENAELTSRLLCEHGFTNVMLVTSWFHSRRALNCFRHYAPEIRFMSVPVERTKPWRYERRYVMAEYAKTIWYAVRYGIWPAASN